MPREMYRAIAPIPALGMVAGDLLILDAHGLSYASVLHGLGVSAGTLAQARLSGLLAPLPPAEGPAPPPVAGHAPRWRSAPPTAFAARVRERMAALGLTQSQLAQRVGLRQSTVSWWTRGGIPRTPNLPALADALETSVEWLLTGADAPAGPPLRLVR